MKTIGLAGNKHQKQDEFSTPHKYLNLMKSQRILWGFIYVGNHILQFNFVNPYSQRQGLVNSGDDDKKIVTKIDDRQPT